MITPILPAELSPPCNWPHWISGCPFYRRENQGQEKWVTCSSHWAGTTEEPVDRGYCCPKAPDRGGFKWPGLAPGLESWTGWLLIQPEAVRAATGARRGALISHSWGAIPPLHGLPGSLLVPPSNCGVLKSCIAVEMWILSSSFSFHYFCNNHIPVVSKNPTFAAESWILTPSFPFHVFL